MDALEFEEALIEELPQAHAALVRRFAETKIQQAEIAASARHQHRRDQSRPVGREDLFAWLFGIGFRLHLQPVLTEVMQVVRQQIQPKCQKLGVAAEDVIQEASVKALRTLQERGGLNGYSSTDLLKWFFRIAVNVAHDMCRQRVRRSHLALAQDPPQLENEEPWTLPLVEPLNACVGELPQEERTVIQLFLQGIAPGEIVNHLPVKVKEVYYRLRRAKELLGACIERKQVEVETW